jgi:DNA-binding CsgD family transcriptional regulator
VDFDAAASVIARPGADPAIDIHAAAGVSADALDVVRQRALALFRLLTVGTGSREDVAVLAAPSPFQSSLHVPLATRGGIVGLSYLVSFRSDAFSEQDRRSLVDLATHAAGAYRRLDGTVRRLRVTPRQAQILSLIAAGLSDSAVAERLGVAHRTVRTHLDRLLREHGLHSRTEAVSAWLRGQQQ